MFGRELSLFRKCVPFTYYVSGPVAAVAQRTFERYPHTFTVALEALEELDTTSYPKMLLAESLQALASGTVEQRQLRELFDQAEHAARDEALGAYDRDRWIVDPEYRLWGFQLHMAAGWWARLLRVSPAPWEEPQHFIHHRYASDVRRDGLITKYTQMVLSQKGRDELNDDITDLFEQIFLLERDLYGQHRFDKRGDQIFLFQSILMSEIGKNPETAGCVLGDVDVINRAGYFKIAEEDQQHRWVKYTVSCKKEDDPEEYSELIEVPEMMATRNPNIPRLSPAGRVLQLENLRAGENSTKRPGFGDAVGRLNTPTMDLIEADVEHDAPPTLTASSPRAYAAMMGSQPAGIIPSIASSGAIELSQEQLADRGFVRVHFFQPVVPRRDFRQLPYYEFDLARPEACEDIGWAPRKFGAVGM
jgi:hypothetical protein